MKHLFFIITTISIYFLQGQNYVVNGTLTPQQLVNQKLLGGGVIATNITYTGNPKSIGFFKTTNKPNPWPANKDSLGLDSGLFLTTGVWDAVSSSVSLPIGQSIFSQPTSTNHSFGSSGQSLDPDLLAASGVSSINDAAILEFDFEPQGDKLEFKFIMASEEYNEYVASFFDVFGFFVNGINVTLAKTNIALVPNTSIPVTIGNVNNGPSPNSNVAPFGPTASSGPCNNCNYYRDNWDSKVNFVYNGMTKVLTAKLNVECGKKYHIKIAIADAIDGAFDSGVFIEANSFKSSQLLISSGTNLDDVAGYEDIIYEGCVVDTITIDRGPNNSTAISYPIIYKGSTVDTTINGDFITPLPNVLTFFAGQSKGQLILKSRTNDGVEPPELFRMLIKLPVTPPSSCTVQPDTLIERTLRDQIPVTVFAGKDSTYECPNPRVTFSGKMTKGVAKDVKFKWYESPAPPFPNDTIRNQVFKVKLDSIFPNRALAYSKSYYFQSVDFCGNKSIDTVTISRLPYDSITGVTQNLFKDCPKDTVVLKGAFDKGVKPYYLNVFGSNDPGLNLANFTDEDTLFTKLDSFKIAVSPLASTTYKIRVQDRCRINPNNLFISKVNVGVGVSPLSNIPLADSTVICEGKSITLKINPSGGVKNYSYAWSNGNKKDSAITVSPESNKLYSFKWTDRCAVDTLSDTILVKVSKVKAAFQEDVPALVNGIQGEALGNYNPTKFNNLSTTNDNSITYEWYINGIKLSTDKDFQFVIDYNKDNVVKLVSTNNQGCINIFEKPIAAQTFVNVPNIFTPDNDNVNEKFASINKGVVNYNLEIFNRWGAKVYESNQPSEGWNGTINGVKAEAGTYFVVLKYNEREGGKENKYQGYVRLVR
jgi:gliding motility-associated-like protein